MIETRMTGTVMIEETNIQIAIVEMAGDIKMPEIKNTIVKKMKEIVEMIILLISLLIKIHICINSSLLC